MSNNRNALFLTGLGGRISQEVAIIDQLIQKKKLELDTEHTFLAATNSGSINLCALNACFRKEHPSSWDSYYKKKFLNNLNNEAVFISSKVDFWDYEPLEETISTMLWDMDLERLSDLPFNSHILTFSNQDQKTYWAGSKTDWQEDISLSELIRCSMLIPNIFKSDKIHGVDNMPTGLPSGTYMDASSAGNFRRFKKQLKQEKKLNGKFDKIYIVSPMRENNTLLSVPKFLDSENIDYNLLTDYLFNISKAGFNKFLNKLLKANINNNFAKEIFVCTPNLVSNYEFMDFNNQYTKYKKVYDWFEDHPNRLAIELNDYLVNYT